MAGGITVHTLRRERNKGKRLARTVMILAGLIFFAGGFYSVAMYSLRQIARIEMVSTLKWDRTITGGAWSFQREYTTVTDMDCMVFPYVNEGERVSKGLEIARLETYVGAGQTEPAIRRIYSQAAGIVSFEPDGLELISEQKDYKALNVEMLERRIGQTEPAGKDNSDIAGFIQEKLRQEGLVAEDFEDMSEEGLNLYSRLNNPHSMAMPRAVTAYSVAVKVKDNLSDCYVYMRLPESDKAPFVQTDTVDVRIEGAGKGKGTVIQSFQIRGGWGLLFKLDSGLEVLRYGRKHQLELLLDSEEKLAVPAGAVVMNNGVLGVYKSEKRTMRWVPVEVVGEYEGMQIIDTVEPGAISPGEMVATRPWIIWDGMRLRS